MSIVTLKRKAKEKQRLRTRGGFILNMTGRGNVLGMNAKLNKGNCGGKLINCAGKRSVCCVGVGEENSKCCRFRHGGKPAPQMGYGVYLNRKSNGAYHPAGGPQCCTNSGAKSGKIVWKQSPNVSASEFTKKQKNIILGCNCNVYGKKQLNNCINLKNICGCNSTDSVSYIRINHNRCTTTEASRHNRTAGEQISYVEANISCLNCEKCKPSLPQASTNSVGSGVTNTPIASPPPIAPPPTVPDAPQNLTLEARDQEIKATWTAPGNDGGDAVTSYEYKLDNGSWTSLGSSSTTVTITGLTNGTQYSVSVRAVNSVGAGASVSASATPATVPGAPQNLTLEAKSDVHIVNDNGINKYVLNGGNSYNSDT